MMTKVKTISVVPRMRDPITHRTGGFTGSPNRRMKCGEGDDTKVGGEMNRFEVTGDYPEITGERQGREGNGGHQS